MHLHAPAKKPKNIATRTELVTVLMPIMPRMTAAQQPAEKVIVIGAPMVCAANPEERRPTKDEKLRMTS